MHQQVRLAILTVILSVFGAGAFAQNAVTATCKDGSSWSGAQRSGACRGHGGVQAFGAAAAAPVTPAAPLTTPVAPVTAAPVVKQPSTSAMNKPTQTPSGGPGQVWVNTTTKVYHCPGDRYYGNTKAGAYMTEAAAKAAGDRADHGKACF